MGKHHCCATKTSFPILCALHWILFMSTWNRCQHHLHRCSLESLQVSELWSLKDRRSFLMGSLTSLAKVHSSPRMWCWQKHVFPSFAYAFCKLWINGLVLFLLREWYQWGVESDPSTECRQRSGTYSYAPFFCIYEWVQTRLRNYQHNRKITHIWTITPELLSKL